MRTAARHSTLFACAREVSLGYGRGRADTQAPTHSPQGDAEYLQLRAVHLATCIKLRRDHLGTIINSARCSLTALALDPANCPAQGPWSRRGNQKVRCGLPPEATHPMACDVHQSRDCMTTTPYSPHSVSVIARFIVHGVLRDQRLRTDVPPHTPLFIHKGSSLGQQHLKPPKTETNLNKAIWNYRLLRSTSKHEPLLLLLLHSEGGSRPVPGGKGPLIPHTWH